MQGIGVSVLSFKRLAFCFLSISSCWIPFLNLKCRVYRLVMFPPVHVYKMCNYKFLFYSQVYGRDVTTPCHWTVPVLLIHLPNIQDNLTYISYLSFIFSHLRFMLAKPWLYNVWNARQRRWAAMPRAWCTIQRTSSCLRDWWPRPSNPISNVRSV